MKKERLCEGGLYFYLVNYDGGYWKILRAYDYQHGIDDSRYTIGNYFISEEDALSAINKIIETI